MVGRRERITKNVRKTECAILAIYKRNFPSAFSVIGRYNKDNLFSVFGVWGMPAEKQIVDSDFQSMKGWS